MGAEMAEGWTREETRRKHRWCDGGGYWNGAPVCAGKAVLTTAEHGQQRCQRCLTRYGAPASELIDTRPLSLRPPNETERTCANMENLMQTMRARVKRIDQIRRLLATLTESERLGLLCETLDTTESELLAAITSGTENQDLPTSAESLTGEG